MLWLENATPGLSAKTVTVGVIVTVAPPVILWVAGAPENVKKGTKGKPVVRKVREFRFDFSLVLVL